MVSTVKLPKWWLQLGSSSYSVGTNDRYILHMPVLLNWSLKQINRKWVHASQQLKIKCFVISKLFCNNRKSDNQFVQGRCHYQENKIPFTWNICKNMFLRNNISRVTNKFSYYFICKFRSTFHCLSVNSNRGSVWYVLSMIYLYSCPIKGIYVLDLLRIGFNFKVTFLFS